MTWVGGVPKAFPAQGTIDPGAGLMHNIQFTISTQLQQKIYVVFCHMTSVNSKVWEVGGRCSNPSPRCSWLLQRRRRRLWGLAVLGAELFH